jgi:hypothetical protein
MIRRRVEGVGGRGEAVESQPTERRKERNHHTGAEGRERLNMKNMKTHTLSPAKDHTDRMLQASLERCVGK